MQFTKIIISAIFLISFSSKVLGKCASYLNISFLSGVRYIDGYGDLSLNRAIMNHHIPKIVQKYGDCIKIHIVYIGEIKKSAEITKFSPVKKIYQGSLFDRAVSSMFKDPERPSQKKYFDKKTGITHWTEDEYKKQFSGKRKIDLQIMVSDTVDSLPGSSYRHYTNKIHEFDKVGSTISFKEYGNTNSLNKDLISNVTINNDGSIHMKVETGPEGAGLFIDDQIKIYKKSEVFKIISSSKNDYLNFINDSAESSINLNENTVSLIHYGSKAGSPAYKKRPIINTVVAYEDYKKRINSGGKLDELPNYLIFSNLLTDLTYEEIMKEIDSDVITQSYGTEMSPDELNSFKKFIKTKIIFASPGKEVMPPELYRSLLSPENGNLFTFVAGYGSLGDSLSQGGIPILDPRNYHINTYDSLKNKISDTAKKLGKSSEFQASLEVYLDLLDGPIYHLIDEKNVEELLKLRYDYFKDFNDIFVDIKKNSNANDIISDAIDASVKAKNLKDKFSTSSTVEKLLDLIFIEKDPSVIGSSFSKILLEAGTSSASKILDIPVFRACISKELSYLLK